MSLIETRSAHRSRRPEAWGARAAGIAGVVVFAGCLIAGFNIGFAAGRPAASTTRATEKSGPELAKLTTKPTVPAATQPVSTKPAPKPEPAAPKSEPAKHDMAAKPDAMEKPAAVTKPEPAMTKPEPAKKPAAKDDEPEPKKPEPKKPDPTPEAKKPEPKKPDPKKPEPKKAAAGPAPTFAKDVSAIVQSKCVECHEAKVKKGGLDARTLASLKKGGGGGPSVVPGDLAKSLLWESIDTNQMPPPGKEQLTDEEKKIIKDWIAGGAK